MKRGAITPGSARALVTGAGSGIGRCYALRLAALGYDLVLAGNRREPLEAAAAEIRAAANRCDVRIVEIDLARTEAAEELWEAVRCEGVEIDVLINNAGIFSFRDILQTPPERIERIILLHALTNTQLCRLAAADMVRRGCRGYILNMSSYSLWMPFPGLSLYSASKAYLRSFSVAFSKEVQEHGIRVTAVCPAGVGHGPLRADAPLAAHRPTHRGAHLRRLVRTARTAGPVAGPPVHRSRLVEPRVDSPLQSAADVGAEADPEVYDEIPGVAIRKKTMRPKSRIVFYDYSVRQSTLSARSIARSM